jgi:hypothetical protein
VLERVKFVPLAISRLPAVMLCKLPDESIPLSPIPGDLLDTQGAGLVGQPVNTQLHINKRDPDCQALID